MAGHVVAAPGRVIAVSQGRLFDRLVRGRLWIGLLAVGLMGIVFMQVSMLSMNAGIGRAVKQSSALESQNAALRAELSRIVIDNTGSDAAAAAGMVVPASGDYHVLSAGDGEAARRAAASLTAPIAPIAPIVTPAPASTTAPAATTTTPTTPVVKTPTPTAPVSTGGGAATAGTPTPNVGTSSGGGAVAPGPQG
jgi:cytoskeletal protein RodZ